MGSFRRLQEKQFSEDAVRRRAARRARREGQIYAKIHDALAEVGEFRDRHAQALYRDTDGSSRKLFGHAGRCAALFVSEALGEYNVPGTVRTTFIGMRREAGRGAHGITDGVISIQVDIMPAGGAKQTLEVPVTVKNGYLLRPGLFYQAGVPYVLSQSALDEVLEGFQAFGRDVRPERKNMFSPPRTAGLGEGIGPQLAARKIVQQAVRGMKKMKTREVAGILQQAVEVMMRGGVPEQQARAEVQDMWAEMSAGKVAAYDENGDWIKPWEVEKEEDESDESDESEEKEAALHVGQRVELVEDLLVDVGGPLRKLNAGTKAFVVDEGDDRGVLVKHDSGVETFIDPQYLV